MNIDNAYEIIGSAATYDNLRIHLDLRLYYWYK